MLLAELGVDTGHVGDRQGVGDITREGEESVFSLSVFVQVGLVDGQKDGRNTERPPMVVSRTV